MLCPWEDVEDTSLCPRPSGTQSMGCRPGHCPARLRGSQGVGDTKHWVPPILSLYLCSGSWLLLDPCRAAPSLGYTGTGRGAALHPHRFPNPTAALIEQPLIRQPRQGGKNASDHGGKAVTGPQRRAGLGSATACWAKEALRLRQSRRMTKGHPFPADQEAHQAIALQALRGRFSPRIPSSARPVRTAHEEGQVTTHHLGDRKPGPRCRH